MLQLSLLYIPTFALLLPLCVLFPLAIAVEHDITSRTPYENASLAFSSSWQLLGPFQIGTRGMLYFS
jgi:hypothetical protein